MLMPRWQPDAQRPIGSFFAPTLHFVYKATSGSRLIVRASLYHRRSSTFLFQACTLSCVLVCSGLCCHTVKRKARPPPNPFIYKAHTNVCKSMHLAYTHLASTHLASTRVRRILAVTLRGRPGSLGARALASTNPSPPFVSHPPPR